MTTAPPDLDPVAVTATIAAAMRAIESDRPDRLIADPFAAALAGETGRSITAQMTEAGEAISLRSRFFDDALLAALSAGVRQVGLIAAGMDTRAWRLELPAGTTVFELDRPQLLDLKAHRLTGARPWADRVAVGVDLTGDWPGRLRAAGHDPARPTVWIAEGLLQYLPEDAVLGLLDTITGCSAPGSTLLLDVVGARLMADPAAQPMLAAMTRMGSPWVFATDDPATPLTARGWTAHVRGFQDFAATVGRRFALGGETSDERGWLVTARR